MPQWLVSQDHVRVLAPGSVDRARLHDEPHIRLIRLRENYTES